MKKVLFLIICLVCITTSVSALSYSGCDYSSISRLKSLVNNVNLSYDYHMSDGSVYFDVTINNVPEDSYFIDTLTRNTYNYSDTDNGEITITNYNGTSGKYNFYSNLDGCYGTKIGTKYYKFPSYNIYYGSDICYDIPNYSLCQKWVKVNYSYSEFQDLVYQYKDKKEEIEEEQTEVTYEKSLTDKIIDIYVNYYYIFLGIIIIVCLIIILIKNRKEKFKL